MHAPHAATIGLKRLPAATNSVGTFRGCQSVLLLAGRIGHSDCLLYQARRTTVPDAPIGESVLWRIGHQQLHVTSTQGGAVHFAHPRLAC